MARFKATLIDLKHGARIHNEKDFDYRGSSITNVIVQIGIRLVFEDSVERGKQFQADVDAGQCRGSKLETVWTFRPAFDTEYLVLIQLV